MNFLMHTGKAESFDPVFSLMEQAFPPCERRNREGQLRVAKHPAYSYRILEDEQGEFLGFLAVWHFGSFRFAEHFAVNEKTRGMGIGSQALRRWLEEEDTPAVLEVEFPETDIARRRIGFYQRLGFVLNEFPYLQPAMQSGQPPVPLKIMSWPGSLSEAEFEPIKQTVYTQVYGVE